MTSYISYNYSWEANSLEWINCQLAFKPTNLHDFKFKRYSEIHLHIENITADQGYRACLWPHFRTCMPMASLHKEKVGACLIHAALTLIFLGTNKVPVAAARSKTKAAPVSTAMTAPSPIHPNASTSLLARKLCHFSLFLSVILSLFLNFFFLC